MPENQPAVTSRERVVPSEILGPLEESGGGVAVTLTATQQAGLWLAVGVGVIMALVIILVGIDWWFRSPLAPALPTDPAVYNATAKDLIADYKSLNELALDRATKLFDLVVVKALLPVFTTILGYIFGSRRQDASNQ